MITIDPRGYFITGSDTDVGKTYVACEIIRQLCRHGVELETRKPAESGCAADAQGETQADDALALQQANNARESIERIAPYRFRAALAPHRAARLEGRELLLEQLIDACAVDDPQHHLLVEGAGGFYSPIAEKGLNADLAGELQLAVFIVVADRIGAVNQALMTIQAVESRQLRIAAVILNQMQAQGDAQMDNAADLAGYCRYPVFRCAHGASLPIVRLLKMADSKLDRLLAPWVFVLTGILFNILSAVITHYFIGLNNEQINLINRDIQNRQVLIDSLWQARTEVERKKEFFILYLANNTEESSLLDSYYQGYLRETLNNHSLDGFDTRLDENMEANLSLLLDVSSAAQASIIASINQTYFEVLEKTELKHPLEKANARLFSIAIFLQLIGLILVLARDLRRH